MKGPIKFSKAPALPEGTFVGYYGKDNEWRLFRARDGIIIGHSSSYNEDGFPVASTRVVTTTRNPDDFYKFVGRVRRRGLGDDPDDPNQTAIE